MVKSIFLDTSAFVGLYIENDDFHLQAIDFLTSLPAGQTQFVTTNFILDETYTFIRKDAGKSKALLFKLFLEENFDQVKVIRVLRTDEAKGWKYFSNLSGRGVSFTDSTSFAVMKRLDLNEVFTFDRDFRKAGFKILP